MVLSDSALHLFMYACELVFEEALASLPSRPFFCRDPV